MTVTEALNNHRVEVVGMEKIVLEKIRITFAFLSKFILYSPSAIMMQINQAIKSANCGARRTNTLH